MTQLCAACASPLADDQRYCLQCGARQGPLRIPARPAPPAAAAAGHQRWAGLVPTRGAAGAVSMAVLASGVLIGVAVGPLGDDASLASARTVVVMPAPGDGFAPAPGGEAVALADPGGNVAEEPPAAAEPEPESEPAEVPEPEAEPEEPAGDPPPSDDEEPAVDPPVEVTGVVAHINPGGGRYVLASPEGRLLIVHEAKLPALGERRAAKLKELEDGTYDETSAKPKGSEAAVRFGGTVTFSDAIARIYVVSVPGASILMHSPAAIAGQPPVAPPAAGSLVTVAATIAEVPVEPAPGSAPPAPRFELRETQLTAEGRTDGPLDIETIVRAVDVGAGTVTLAADDVGESGRDIVARAEPGVRTDQLRPGQLAEAQLRLGADGAATLVEIHSRKPAAASASARVAWSSPRTTLPSRSV